MDYEKAYKEALKRAKGFKTDEYKDVAEYIFPELKESEDERIRKALISFLKSPFVNENITDEKVAPWIAWLEKQGEQKAKYHDVCDKCVRQPTCQSDCFLQQDEQKSAWSEEDDEMLNGVIKSCEQCGNEYAYYWLKSLKERYTWKPSDEQMEALEKECIVHSNYELCRLLEQLKKLKG